jgi:lipopolysaccharide export system protein LptA
VIIFCFLTSEIAVASSVFSAKVSKIACENANDVPVKILTQIPAVISSSIETDVKGNVPVNKYRLLLNALVILTSVTGKFSAIHGFKNAAKFHVASGAFSLPVELELSDELLCASIGIV